MGVHVSFWMNVLSGYQAAVYRLIRDERISPHGNPNTSVWENSSILTLWNPEDLELENLSFDHAGHPQGGQSTEPTAEADLFLYTWGPHPTLHLWSGRPCWTILLPHRVGDKWTVPVARVMGTCMHMPLVGFRLGRLRLHFYQTLSLLFETKRRRVKVIANSLTDRSVNPCGSRTHKLSILCFRFIVYHLICSGSTDNLGSSSSKDARPLASAVGFLRHPPPSW